MINIRKASIGLKARNIVASKSFSYAFYLIYRYEKVI